MATLALNMIVAPAEAGLLKRCLDSFHALECFDEIVIVNTSLDEKVNEIARLYSDKVFYFQWETEEHPNGDFAGARNLALQNTESENVMWLDSDDVMLGKDLPKWLETVKLLKDEKNSGIEQWSIQYALICDPSGNPQTSFWRERVFKRTLHSWKRPVHETLSPEWEQVKNAKINGLYITHLPTKPSYVSALRNVKILEPEYAKNPEDIQIKYFLGRDLLFIGRIDEGVKILTDMIDNIETGSEMSYAICIELVWLYAYGNFETSPQLDKMKTENLQKVQSWCRQALSFSASYAEPYVVLGDVYLKQGAVENASKMYATAMKKKIGSGKFQNHAFYTELPAERLSRIFAAKKNYDMALHFNRIAVYRNNCDAYIFQRRELIQKLVEEFNNDFSKN